VKYVRFLAWPLATLTFVVAVATPVFEFVAPLRGDGLSDFVGPLPMTVVAVVGALIATRRPRNAVGWLFLAISFLLVAQAFAQRYARYDYLGHHLLPFARLAAWFGYWSFIPAIGCLGLVFMLFPTGAPVGRWARPLVALSVLLVAVTPILALPSLADPGRLMLLAPSTAEVPRAGALNIVGELGINVIVLLGVVMIVVRFVGSRGIERQQMKWFTLGALVLALSFVAIFVSAAVLHNDDPVDTPIGATAQMIGFCAVAITIGIAVLRYRIYDIDRIISRTLAYVIVTGSLVAVYVLLAVVPPSLAGARNVPSWLIALVTLVVAVLFRPVRRRVQDAVDRRFNRARYDAEKTIEMFASRLRDDIDLDTLQGEIHEVVRETMQPRHVSLWLRS
jgi:hypothetical protein